MDENINEAKEEIASAAPAQGAPQQAEPQPAPAVQPQKGKDNALMFELGIIAFGELVVNLITVLVYALLDKINYTVFTGALLGTAVTILNFFILTLSVNNAINKYMALRGTKQMSDEEAEQFAHDNSMVIQNAMTRSYIIRSLLMLGVLVGAFLLKQFDVIATLVPLVCYRPIIFVSELLKKRRIG